ncbi:unnamed protein product [Arctia plantaginis]|uniref:Uncharacterized protein n=1 Tax=Arctia plantaginis TaxID=874455 RepID=A0A8S1B3W5_ARCPL|nr:unnamed protein product [Arctia plantaginis]
MATQLLRKITLLQSKKEALFQRTQETYDLSLKVSDHISQTKFLSRIKSLEHTRTEFLETVDDLNLLFMEQDKEVKPTYSEINSFDDLYCHIKMVENSLLRPDCVQKPKITPKLPPLQLACFDGIPNNWAMFYQNFKSLIHDNPRLTAAEKVQYLVGNLSNKALSVCSSIPPIGENLD